MLAFLETGAFIGLVAPGETTVIVGGLVAGQGEISLLVLIAIVWTCAVLGDLTSYALGRRLGREFMVRHGARVKITEERLEQVEAFFERRGGTTILIGRFIGLVRAIAPFIAGASRMPLRKFLPYDVLGAGLVGDDVLRARLRVLALVRPAHRLGVARAVRVRPARRRRSSAIVFLVRLQRSPELQAQDAGVDRRAARAAAAAAGRAVPARGLAPRRAGRSPARRRRPARFVWNRFTPGELGLEVTTLLASPRSGRSPSCCSASELRRARRCSSATGSPFDIADRLLLADASRTWSSWVTALGSFAVARRSCSPRRRGRARAAASSTRPCSPAAFLLTWLAVDIAKAAFDRPRPPGALRGDRRAGLSVGPRGLRGRLGRLRGRAGARRAAASRRASPSSRRRSSLAVVIGLTRVYLRAHYLSDVEGGWGLAAAIFALLGIVAVVVGHLRQNGRAASMSNQTWTYIAIGVGRRHLADRVGGAGARPGLDVVLPRLGAARRRRC